MRPANDELEAVGQALASLCKKKGYSYRELAKVSGVAQGTISNMAGGKTFEISNLFKVLKVLNTQIGDFFMDAGFTDESDQYTDTILRITVRSRGFRRAYGEMEKGDGNAAG